MQINFSLLLLIGKFNHFQCRKYKKVPKYKNKYYYNSRFALQIFCYILNIVRYTPCIFQFDLANTENLKFHSNQETFVINIKANENVKNK